MVRKKESQKSKEYITTIADPAVVLVEKYIRQGKYEMAQTVFELALAVRRHKRILNLVEEVFVNEF